eukprot:TRINITY_DN1659_c0_g1_i2.p1 TRINITY_DN1659_c0_g1~~TRINITY_DN1659_c0_g1_i2.p1  ORF type:complete len:383 (+),score=67.13 TRINITY_DN1659_c0_g1_i2:89-1237(+)
MAAPHYPPFYPPPGGMPPPPQGGMGAPPAVGLPHLLPATPAHIPTVYPPSIVQVTSSSYGNFYMTPQLYGAAPEYVSTGYDVYGKLATAQEAMNSNNRASAVIAYQMGASLAHDHLGAERCAELRKSQIIIMDCTSSGMPVDPRMRLMIDTIGTSTITNLTIDALNTTPIAPLTRTIFLMGVPGKDNSAFQPISEIVATRLREFVENGGHLISIGNAVQHLTQIFDLSDTIEPTTRYILQKLASKIQLGKANPNSGVDTDDEEIKRYFSAYGEGSFVVLEPNNVAVKILDPSKVLVLCTATELHKKLGSVDSLVFQLRKGRGVVTHLTSIFCRKKKLHVNLPQDYAKELKKHNSSGATMMAWKLAAEVMPAPNTRGAVTIGI